MPLSNTPNFGFTRLDATEGGHPKNGYAFTDADRTLIDLLFNAFAQHTHEGTAVIANPSAAPTLTLQTSGGSLPASTLYEYAIAYVDAWGLQTAHTSAQIATGGTVAAPDPPTLTHEATGGTLGLGTYSYMLTWADAQGGETTSSIGVSVNVESGDGTSRIRLDLPAMPAEASYANIYRAKPGQSKHYYLKQVTGTPAYDDGSVTENTARTPPRSSTFASSNQVVVTLPETPSTGVQSWRLYRTATPGTFPSNSLITEVARVGDTLATQYTDDGSVAPSAGQPRTASSVVGDGRTLARTWSAHLPGTLVDGKVYARFTSPMAIRPTQLSATFNTLPSGLTGGATPAQVLLRLSDSAATPTSVDLVCSDDTGQYELASAGVTLAAGVISLSVVFVGAPTPGGDVNFTLWFE